MLILLLLQRFAFQNAKMKEFVPSLGYVPALLTGEDNAVKNVSSQAKCFYTVMDITIDFTL